INFRIHAKIVGAHHNSFWLVRCCIHWGLSEKNVMQNIIRQLGWFVAVGCAAAATHWLVVVATVDWLGLAPLLANVIGWLVAFVVSFAGHYRLTFRQQRAPLFKAARRFFAVSALGFGANELAYAWLLQATPLRYD